MVAALCSEKHGSPHRRFLMFPIQPVVFAGCVLCPNPRCLWKKLNDVIDSWSIEVLHHRGHSCQRGSSKQTEASVKAALS